MNSQRTLEFSFDEFSSGKPKWYRCTIEELDLRRAPVMARLKMIDVISAERTFNKAGDGGVYRANYPSGAMTWLLVEPHYPGDFLYPMLSDDELPVTVYLPDDPGNWKDVHLSMAARGILRYLVT